MNIDCSEWVTTKRLVTKTGRVKYEVNVDVWEIRKKVMLGGTTVQHAAVDAKINAIRNALTIMNYPMGTFVRKIRFSNKKDAEHFVFKLLLMV